MPLTGNITPALAGVAGVSSPIWLTWLPVIWQYGIGGLGAVVLVLTAWNKWLDIQQKRREFKK